MKTRLPTVVRNKAKVDGGKLFFFLFARVSLTFITTGFCRYFHRVPRHGTSDSQTPSAAGGYRGGSRKGLDLTFGGPVSISSKFFPETPSPRSVSEPQLTPGNSVDPLRGGILFRSIRRVRDGSVISGPSLLVDEVLKASGAASIEDLVLNKWDGDISALQALSSCSALPSSRPQRASLYLRPKDQSTGSSSSRGTLTGIKARIYRSPRIGLDLSHFSIPKAVEDALKHPRVSFISKPYRYFVQPRLLTANGRAHTFLGVYKDDLRPTGQANRDLTLDQIVSATGLKNDTAKKYRQDYLQGYQGETTLLKGFLGVAGKGASSSPGTFLKMMGILKKVQEADKC